MNKYKNKYLKYKNKYKIMSCEYYIRKDDNSKSRYIKSIKKMKRKGKKVISVQFQLVIGKSLWHFKSVKSTNLL